jgi:hypothetical protein
VPAAGCVNNDRFGSGADGFKTSNNLRSYRETKRGAIDIGITASAILSLGEGLPFTDRLILAM